VALGAALVRLGRVEGLVMLRLRFPNVAAYPASFAACAALVCDPTWTAAWSVLTVAFVLGTVWPEVDA
jgi:hypothetical protein